MGLYGVSGISKLSVCGPVKLSFRAGNLPGSNPGDFNRLSVGLYGVSGTDQSSVEEIAAGHSDRTFTTPPDNGFARCPELYDPIGESI